MTRTMLAPAPSATVQRGVATLLQRKCACGASAGLSGECAECQEKKMPGMQPKLAISEPGNPYEQEADRVAEQVMRMPESVSVSNEITPAQRPWVQMRVSRKNRTAYSEAPPIVHEVLSSSGEPLGTATRAFFEPRFGQDFSRVRIHADDRAAASAQTLAARAYTVASDVVFGASQFAPSTDTGRQLLAHELTHVIQQQSASSQRKKPEVMSGGSYNGPGSYPLPSADTYDLRSGSIPPLITLTRGKLVQKQDDKNASTANIDWSERELGAVSASSQSLPAVREKALGALRASEMALRAAIDSRNNGNGIPKAISDAMAASFPGESESFLDLLLRRIELVQRIVPDVRIYPCENADSFCRYRSEIRYQSTQCRLGGLSGLPCCCFSAIQVHRHLSRMGSFGEVSADNIDSRMFSLLLR